MLRGRRQEDGTNSRTNRCYPSVSTPAPERIQEEQPYSVVGLLLRHVLGLVHFATRLFHLAARLLFLGAQEAADPSQRVRREDEAGGDEGLAARHHAVAAALLVLAVVGVQGVFPALARQTEGEERIVHDGSLDLGCVFLHDREGLVDFAEATVGDGVGFGNDRSDQAVWFLRVRKNRLDEGFEAAVGDVKRFLSVGIALEGGDGVIDDGIGFEMLTW